MLLLLSQQKVTTTLQDLEHLGDLGHGTCGHVVKMRHKQTNKVFAVKVSKTLFKKSVYLSPFCNDVVNVVVVSANASLVEP